MGVSKLPAPQLIFILCIKERQVGIIFRTNRAQMQKLYFSFKVHSASIACKASLQVPNSKEKASLNLLTRILGASKADQLSRI